MKNTENKKAVINILVSFAVAVVLAAMWLEIIPDFMSIPLPVRGNVALIFPAVPFFLLQVFLCKTSEKIKWRPMGIITFVAASCGIAFALSSGWDSLGWLILLIMCIAPAVGTVAGFVYYRFKGHRVNFVIKGKKKYATAGLILLFVAVIINLLGISPPASGWWTIGPFIIGGPQWEIICSIYFYVLSGAWIMYFLAEN